MIIYTTMLSLGGMFMKDKEKKLFLLVDIDDFIVHSSDQLQKIVDKQTNFKTEVLEMLEQLNRNCRYFVEEVTKECEEAKELGIKPDLSHLEIFDNLKYGPDDDIYSVPIECAKYYADVANLLLNQFLEERDTFLETDNMRKGSKRIFNYEKEMQTTIKYSALIHNNMGAFHKINEFCYEQAKSLIHEAKSRNTDGSLTVPVYGSLVRMDTNDIIKKGHLSNLSGRGYKEYVLYQKPLENLANCLRLENRLHDIVTNAKVFTEPSKEIVDYERIHSLDNVNWDAVALVRNLIRSGRFAGVYFSTHHNGGREEFAKIRLMRRILPEVNGFIGQRFHDSEHDAERRLRSSKIDRAMEYLGILASQIVLLDDSKENCRDCNSKGGIAILYRPETDSEKINNRIEETGFNRIQDLRNNNIDEMIDDAIAYQKRIA